MRHVGRAAATRTIDNGHSSRSLKFLIEQAQHISLVLHINPDGDAIGSAWALKNIITKTKTVDIVSKSELPLVFSDCLGRVLTKEVINNKSDLILVLDNSELHRTGSEKEIIALSASGKKIAAIDHHHSGNIKKIADCYIHDPQASSTAQIIYTLTKDWGTSIDDKIANALLLGIYTDTGGFRHANTSSQTLEIASRLIRLGANLSKISQSFSPKGSITKIKLWGRILSDLKVNKLGLIVVRVSKKLLEETGSSFEDLSGLGNLLVNLERVKAVVILSETDNGYQGSLRTKSKEIDVSRLAHYFGGKGNRRSAGFVFDKQTNFR